MISGFSALLLFTGLANAQLMPQDSWAYYGKKLSVPSSAHKKGIAVSDSAIYVGATVAGLTTSIQKYDTSGAFLNNLSTSFTDVAGIVCDSTGNLYIFDLGAGSLKAFDPSGTLLWSKGSAGSGQEQFSTTTAANQFSLLAIDQADTLYVLDRGNSRVQIFDKLGNFQSMWGSVGTGAGFLTTPRGIVARNGNVFILDYPASNSLRIQKFTSAGVYSKNLTRSSGTPINAGLVYRYALTPEGLLVVHAGAFAYPSWVIDSDLQNLGTMPLPAELNGSSPAYQRYGGAFAANGDLWSISEGSVLKIERRHSTTDNPVVPTALPLPEVIKVQQRPASTLLDIDFKVNDADSATVDVAALAFVDGGGSLNDILRLATLVEGTDVNVGPGQAANVPKRITWNAAADWSSSFGEVQIEVLARDARSLLGTHWITVPASGGVPSFQASAKPVEDADLLSIWFWLVAKGDAEIALVNGEVKGVGGTYDGQVLASDVSTTPAGRDFLYQRIGVRAITNEELTSIQSGNYGFSSSDANTVVVP